VIPGLTAELSCAGSISGSPGFSEAQRLPLRRRDSGIGTPVAHLHARGPLGQDIEFLAQNYGSIPPGRASARVASLTPRSSPPPAGLCEWTRQGAQSRGDLGSVYQTLQASWAECLSTTSMLRRVWQVYVQAEGDFRTEADNVGQFALRNSDGQPVPSRHCEDANHYGPEFTNRFNGYRAAQINGILAPAIAQARNDGVGGGVCSDMREKWVYDYSACRFREGGCRGVPPAPFSGSRCLRLPDLAALYESWSLPLSILSQCRSRSLAPSLACGCAVTLGRVCQIV